MRCAAVASARFVMRDSTAVPPPSPGEWVAIKCLFELALSQPPELRTAFVRRGAPTPRIAAEVLSLMAHGAGEPTLPGDFLAEPAPRWKSG